MSRIAVILERRMDEINQMLDTNIAFALAQMLKEIEAEFQCQAMLAGGALRDLIVFRKPKDLDVFLIGYKEHKEGSLAPPHRALGDYASGMHIILEKGKRGFQLEAFEFNVEIISTDNKEFKTPDSVLEGFGVDISMVGMLSNGDIITCKGTPSIDDYFCREYRINNEDRLDYRYQDRLSSKGWRQA